MPSRSHSLNDAVSLRPPITTVDKGEGKQPPTRARARAGTIRASDYQKILAPPLSRSSLAASEVSISRTRRTRSGTIVGPNASDAIVAPVALSAIPADPRSSSSSRLTAQRNALPLAAVEDVAMESDDELLLKSPGWVDADFEYLGLPARKKRQVCGKSQRAPRLTREIDKPHDLLARGGSPDPLAMDILRTGNRKGG